MDLLCLIKLLLEKEYIHDKYGCCLDGRVVSTTYEYEYKEIYDKIINSEYDKDNIFILKTRFEKNRFCILNVKKLEKGLIRLGENKEEFGFRADHHNLACIEPDKLRRIIENKTRFHVSRMSTDQQVFFKLHDSYVKKQRIIKEAKRKEEILDFLDKLP